MPLLLGLTLALTLPAASPGRLAAQGANAGAASFAGSQELVVELRIGRLARQTVLVYQQQGTLLLPARALFDLAEIRVEIDASGRLAAVRLPRGIHLRVEPAARRAWVGKQEVAAELVQVRWTGQQLFLGAPLVEALFDLHVLVDLGELTVTLDPVADLPIGRRVSRERLRMSSLQPAAETPPDRVVGPEPVRWRGAALDWSVNMPTIEDLASTSYQLDLGSNFVGGDLELRYRGGSRGSAALPWTGSWVRAWADRPHFRQLHVGAVGGSGPRARNIYGFAISNSPFYRPVVFGKTVVRGYLEPGWEVELYRDGELVNFTLTNEDGFYELDAVIEYGPNPVELRAYGPNGEMRVLERAIRISPDRLPDRAVEYAISAGGCTAGECQAAVNADFRYGWNSLVTLRGGADVFLRRAASDLGHPYLQLDGAVHDHWLVRLASVINAYHAAELSYEPSSDLRALVGHVRYDTGVERPLLTPSGQATLSQGSVFWRPNAARRSQFLNLSMSRVTGLDWSRLRSSIGVTTQLRNIRWTGEWRVENYQSGGTTTPTKVASITGSTALRSRLLPGLTGLFVRGTMDIALDAGNGPIDRVGFILGKTVHSLARIELKTTWSQALGGFTINLGVNASRGFVNSINQVSRTADGQVSSASFLEGAVLWNDAAGHLEALPARSTGRGGVSGVVFLDGNENGERDPGEDGIPDARVFVGPYAVRTDGFGRYSVWDLGPFDAASVTLDIESLRNPLWVPQDALASVSIMPNGFREVDLPVVEGSELVGRVMRDSNAGSVGIGGVRVVLTHLASNRRFETLTFHDGEFYLMALPPGVYEVTIPSNILKQLGLMMEEEPLRIEVHPAVDWQRPPEVYIGLFPVDPFEY